MITHCNSEAHPPRTAPVSHWTDPTGPPEDTFLKIVLLGGASVQLSHAHFPAHYVTDNQSSYPKIGTLVPKF